MSRQKPFPKEMSHFEHQSISAGDAELLLAAREMCERATQALVRAYGPNCFARHEYLIPPEHTFMRGAPNLFIHTPASP